MRKLLLWLLLACGFIIRSAAAQSDDITLMGSVSPLFYLENAFEKTVTTADGTALNLTVSDIAVESDRVLVRFYLIDLPDSWKALVTDDSRLYGSYLPISEIVLNDGTILTPSSASRYSLLEFNGRLILGGLLIFDTDRTPQVFYLNFNQLPFDTQPLSEGFTEAVILKSAENQVIGTGEPLSDTHNGITFGLSATAQATAYTMIQPSVRMEREDELFSKFGWITFTDSETSQRYAATRGNLYGFNLADDEAVTPAHAYVFRSLYSDTPLLISMDHAYVVRSYEPVREAAIPLNVSEATTLLADEDFTLIITDIVHDPEQSRMRLYMDAGEFDIADISFYFPESNGAIQPSAACGIDPNSRIFACDIYFDENSYPSSTLRVEIDAIEYYKEGPWTIRWTPAVMDTVPETPTLDTAVYPYSSYGPQDQKAQPESVQKVLESIEKRNSLLAAEPGWICESYLLDYQFAEGYDQGLIQTDQIDFYFTRYLSETWSRIDNKGKVHEILSLIRNAETMEITSAQWIRAESSIDLLHALAYTTTQQPDYDYASFADFSSIASSSAIFMEETSCGAGEAPAICLRFSQSLNGIPDSPGSQSITFELDADDLYIRRETVDYDFGQLVLGKATVTLERFDSLPDDIQRLMDSVIE